MFLRRLAASPTRCFFRAPSFRTHMNHGGGGPGAAGAARRHPQTVGPRSPVTIGLEAAEASQHILRLLEATAIPYSENMDGIWHEAGYSFEQRNGHWTAQLPQQQEGGINALSDHVLSLHLLDDRTALVKTQSKRGTQGLCALLRIDGGSAYYNGWTIVRKLCQSDDSTAVDPLPLASISQTLEQYFATEHGGGEADATSAQETLFVPTLATSTCLLTVGIDAPDAPASPWSAPTGVLLTIPLATYLDGVRTQTPHASAASRYDAVLAVDVLPCHTAAVATVRVGNGTRLFYDYLFLGYADAQWRILSKIFSVQPWPVGA